MTSRRTVLGLLMTMPALLATAPPKSCHLVVVSSRRLQAYDTVLRAFEGELIALGYGVVRSDYDLAGQESAWPSVSQQVALNRPDLILAVGTQAARALRAAPLPGPCLFTMVLDPQVVDWAQDENSVLPGVALHPSAAFQLESIAAGLPKVKRLGVLYHPETSLGQVIALKRAAIQTGHSIEAKEVKSAKEVSRAAHELSRQVDGLLAVADSTVYTSASVQYLLLHSLRQAQPFIGLYESFARAGAVMSIGVDYVDIGRQSAELARHLLVGDEVKGGWIQAPDAQVVYINERTARRIGHVYSGDFKAQARVVQ